MTAHTKKHDVVVIGAGPAGSGVAMFLQQMGIQSVILEKERFPRFHIGESMTGEAGGQVRKLGLEEAVSAQGHAIKHGTMVYGATGENSFYIPVKDRGGPDGGLRQSWAWQVRRSKFDQLLLDSAVERGAELIPTEAVSVLTEDDRVCGVRCRTAQGSTEDLKAEVVIDASGPATFLANRGVASPREGGNYDKQVGIFSQVVGAIRDPGETSGDTLILYRQKNHWAWFIPLDDEVVSIGIVVPSDYFTSHKLSKYDFFCQELRTINPQLSKRVMDVKFVDDMHGASNYSYYLRHFTGKGFLCVGDAHRFVDPIFSLGLMFALKEAEYAAETVRDYLAGQNRDVPNPFAAYEKYVDQGQDIIQVLLDCFWEFPLPFVRLAHLTHHDEIVDIFAGRVFGPDKQELESVVRMRRLLDLKASGQLKSPVA